MSLSTLVLPINSRKRKEENADVPMAVAAEIGFELMVEVDPEKAQSLGATTVTMMVTVLMETAHHIAEAVGRGRKRKHGKKNGVPNERTAIDANEEKEGDHIRRHHHHHFLYPMTRQSLHILRHRRPRIGKEKRKGGEARAEKDARRIWITTR